MLRRQPTKITLTTEDIANYEDARAREATLAAQQAAAAAARMQQQGNNNNINNNNNQNVREDGGNSNEIQGLSLDRTRGLQQQQQGKSREERLGLGGRS